MNLGRSLSLYLRQLLINWDVSLCVGNLKKVRADVGMSAPDSKGTPDLLLHNTEVHHTVLLEADE